MFKKGDKLLCIQNNIDGKLKLGEIYTASTDPIYGCVRVAELKDELYDICRFKLFCSVEELIAQQSFDKNSNQGVKHDTGKPLLAAIPPSAIEEEGKVWTFGANKYGLWNWKKGLVYTRILSAILRHTMAIMKGEDLDPESGLLHAAHIRCNAGMLIEFHMTNRKELDDRSEK